MYMAVGSKCNYSVACVPGDIFEYATVPDHHSSGRPDVNSLTSRSTPYEKERNSSTNAGLIAARFDTSQYTNYQDKDPEGWLE